MRFGLSAATAFALSGALVIGAFGGAGAAQAAPRSAPSKVTICHRTHSVKNPYRMITVSKNSVDGPLNVRSGGGTQNDGDHAGYAHNKQDSTSPYAFDGNFPTYAQADPSLGSGAIKVFDGRVKTFYNANPTKKIWQDIIPSFESGGRTYAGLNWDVNGLGRKIFYGTGGTYGQCKKMSASAYLASEREALGTGPNDKSNDADILADMQDQGADGDPTLNNTSDLDALPVEPTPPAGPNPGTDFENLLNRLNNDNAGKLPTELTQSIAGVVWYDDDKDGEQNGSERSAQGVSIQLFDPTTGALWSPVLKKTIPAQPKVLRASTSSKSAKTFSFASSRSLSIRPATVSGATVTTNANGYFEFNNVPAGDWKVVVITPSGYSYTYDSSGSGDGNMPGTTVPEGGAGFAWAGLVAGSTIELYDAYGNLISSSKLAATGTNTTALGAGLAGAIALVGAGGALIWSRRRRAK